MRFKDTSRWIWREMRESKAFTSLNIMGVTLNVSLMVVFLALVAGLELTTIRQMTKLDFIH